jgi:hypothetical protein
MTVDKNRFTKLERKELRRLAGLAYERELARALESLEGRFRQWRESKITAFELNDCIHQFHNGTSRDLWRIYTGAHSEIVVTRAMTNGVIQEAEISLAILEKLKRPQT